MPDVVSGIDRSVCSSIVLPQKYVLLPEDVRDIENCTDMEKVFVSGRCGHGCVNADSFTVARNQYVNFGHTFEKDSRPVLVLNLANPVNPGGGVRRGARAQEEDLCRKSSLLLSLESEAASRYYEYNRSLHSYMGSDAMIFTPQVEIIRDEDGSLLEDSVIVAVLTCAAPMVKRGMEGLSEAEYRKMVCDRITGMLKCAAYFGYRHLVLDRTAEQYNFKEYFRNFGSDHFFRDEDQKEIDSAMKICMR